MNKIDLHLTESQLKKIQNAFKNKNATTMRLSNANFNKNKLIHELYLTEKQMKKLIDKINGDMGNSKNFTTLIISNDDLDDLIKIITALEEHEILLKGTTKTIENETKKQEGGFLSML